nr:hypothetical protein ['Planchonia careya' phytoplasma]
MFNLGYDVEIAKLNVKKLKYFEAFQLQTKNHSKRGLAFTFDTEY